MKEVLELVLMEHRQREEGEFTGQQPGGSGDDHSNASSEDSDPWVPPHERIWVFMPQVSRIWRFVPGGPHGLLADGVLHLVWWMFVRIKAYLKQ